MPDEPQPDLFTENEYVDDLSQPGPSPFIQGLNPDQLDAVVHPDGPLLVVAGAGSGKTRVLTHRIAHLIDQGVPPSSILAITFTNKAAAEMRERVANLVGPVVKAMWVSTFHSACVRILRRDAEVIGYPRTFSIYDQADAVRLTGYVIRDLGLDSKRFTPRGVHGYISIWKNELTDPAQAAADARDIFARKHADVYAEYQARLQKAGAMDFDDLLLNVVKLFREHPDVLEHYRQRFQHILVDEFQDTNTPRTRSSCCWREATTTSASWATPTNPSTRFRGADFRNILQFEDAFPDVTMVVLEQNYRSTQTILDAANAVIENNVERKPKSLWTDTGMGDRIVRYHAEDEGDEAIWVAGTAQQLHRDDGMNWREIAVLYRTNAQSRVIEEAFMRMGVPYKVVGGTRFYDRREIKDAMAYLRALVNPADEVNVKRVLNVPKRGRRRRQRGAARRVRPRRRASPSSRRCDAPRKPASPGRPAAASPRSSTCSTRCTRWWEPTGSARATCCRRRSTAPATSPSSRPRTRSRPTAGSRTSASWSARPASSPCSTSSSSRSRWSPTPTSSTRKTRSC